MLTFLFWNLRGNPLETHLAELCRVHDVDTLILAETEGTDDGLLVSALADHVGGDPYTPLPVLGCRKIRIHTRLPGANWQHVRDTQDLTVRALHIPGGQELIVAATHLPSRLRNNSRSNQAAICGDVAEEIGRVETQRGHARTVLVGDLNVDPYDSGMIEATGLNAVMERRLAQQGTRRLRTEREYRMFYNPMWRFFGDAAEEPPGSYYYRTSENDCVFWHVFDQVLVRGELIPALVDTGRLTILTGYTSSGGDHVALTSPNGLPRSEVSDHLPVLFGLDLP
jgi:hypothetical protein